MRAREHTCVRVCVSACVRLRLHPSVCVCERERERGREGGREGGRERACVWVVGVAGHVFSAGLLSLLPVTCVLCVCVVGMDR